MKTIVTVEVTHDQPIPGLAGQVAARVWSLAGVRGAQELRTDPRQAVQELRDAGFTFEEIALGMREVAR